MPLVSDQIRAATHALLAHRNADDGIEATKSGDSSGCWTTASALWSIISTGAISFAGIAPLRKMVSFLLAKQLTDGEDRGGWPMLPGAAGCTMATGHTVSALVLAKQVFVEEIDLINAINDSIARAMEWLERWQNADGGWGPEPIAGGTARESLVLSTHYAAMAFWHDDPMGARCDSLRDRAIKYFKSVRNDDGSWGLKKNSPGTVSDTARGIITLILCKGSKPDDKIIANGIRFILRSKNLKGLWSLSRVELLFPKASAIFYYTNNSVVDALIAFSLNSPGDAEVHKVTKEGVKWLLQAQEASTGLCYVVSPHDDPNKNMYTWPTAEWMHAVNAVADTMPSLLLDSPSNSWKKSWFKIGYALLLPVVLLLGIFLDQAWSSFSQNTKDFITITVILTIILNISAAFMFESVKGWFRRLRM